MAVLNSTEAAPLPPSGASSLNAKKEWLKPEVRMLSAGEAENSANPGGGDGVFSSGS
jgi:hypothetical protein